MAKAKKKNNNQPLLYGAVFLMAVVAFGAVYFYTGGDFAKLTGAAIACGENNKAPEVSITNTENLGDSLVVSIEVTDDCGLAKVAVNEKLLQLRDGDYVTDMILGNEYEITDNELTFSNTYVFPKSNYNLTGGKLEVEFIATDVTDKTTTVKTEQFDI